MSTNPYESPFEPDLMDRDKPPAAIPLSDGLGPVMFGAAVRLAGLLVGLNGLKWIYFGFIETVVSSRKDVDALDYFLSSFGYLVAGIVLLRGAPYFVAFAYPKTTHGDGEVLNEDG